MEERIVRHNKCFDLFDNENIKFNLTEGILIGVERSLISDRTIVYFIIENNSFISFELDDFTLLAFFKENNALNIGIIGKIIGECTNEFELDVGKVTLRRCIKSNRETLTAIRCGSDFKSIDRVLYN